MNRAVPGARSSPGTHGAPLLSVVVPVYNVEQYLAECLNSILAQDYADLEIVVVDDGSTDGSAAVAQGYARRHGRVALVSSVNQGPGPARNLGVKHCRGEYLAFADADDTVPPHAYSLLVSTVTDSGSDFVVGSLQRHIDGELVEPPFLRSPHRRRRIGIRIDDLPAIMRNVFPVNKVFRRSFWDSARLEFPAGMIGEDQVAMTEAYLRAAAFDVVPEPVYHWHNRGAGSSITQRRYQLGDLRDRITTKQLTTDLVCELGSPQVRDYWARHGLGGDLPLYFRHIPGCGDDYWRTLVAGVRQLYADQPPIHESHLLRVQHRLVGWLVTHDRRTQAEAILRWLEQHPGPLPLQTSGGHVVALLPFHDDPNSDIPPELFRLADHELTFDARLFSAQCSEGVLELVGAALIRGAPTDGATPRIEVALCSDAGQRVGLDVEQRPSPDATRWIDRLPQRYDGSEFVARVDVAALTKSGVCREGDRWHVELSVEVADIRREGLFRTKAPGANLPLAAAGDVAVRATFEPSSGLVITVAEERASFS